MMPPRHREILAVLANGPAFTDEVAEQLGEDTAQARLRLLDLEYHGYVTSDGAPMLWTLTAAGRAERLRAMAERRAS